MTIVIPLDFLKELATNRGISDTEIEVLSLAINGEKPTDIAKKLDISPEAVRKRLSEVYRKFSISGDGPGKLAQLQPMLLSQYQEHQSFSRLNSNVLDNSQEASTNSDYNRENLWETVPETCNELHGRNEEMTKIEKWIVKDRCRMVTIIGMRGIGKTSLVAHLAKQIQNDFEHFLGWYSLRRAIPITPIKVLLDKILSFLQPQEAMLSEEEETDKISLLIQYLSRHRCLLVLDDVEAILDKAGTETSQEEYEECNEYRKECEEYGKLLQRLGKEYHQSCLILIGLERPKVVRLLEKQNLFVRSLLIGDLEKADLKKILKPDSLKDNNIQNDEDMDRLIECCGGNFLILKIFLATIKELFSGSVTAFLDHDTLVFDEIRDLLDQQFQRLSDSEKEVINFLANAQEPVLLSTIKQNLKISPSELIEAMIVLKKRLLIGSPENPDAFTLKKVIREYVATNHSVEPLPPKTSPSKEIDDKMPVNSDNSDLISQNLQRSLEIEKDNKLFDSNISEVLDQKFQRLSEIEKDVMYCLAIALEPIWRSEIENQLSIKQKESGPTIKSLKDKSLICEEKLGKIMLNKDLMLYVTNYFSKQISQEIVNIFTTIQEDKNQKKQQNQITEFKLLKKPIFIKKQTQEHPIITVIKDNLNTIFGSENLRKNNLTKIQSVLKEKFAQEEKLGKAIDNISNLI